MTALMASARWNLWGNANVVVVLLEHGADANLVDTYGRTALDHALGNSYSQDIVSTLCAWPTLLDKTDCP